MAIKIEATLCSSFEQLALQIDYRIVGASRRAEPELKRATRTAVCGEGVLGRQRRQAKLRPAVRALSRRSSATKIWTISGFPFGGAKGGAIYPTSKSFPAPGAHRRAKSAAYCAAGVRCHRPDTTRYRRDSSAASAGGSTDHPGEPCFTGVRLPRAALAPLVCNLDEPMPLIPSLADAIPFPKIGWRVLQRPSIGLQCCARLSESDHRAGDDRSNAGPSSTACVRDPGWR